MLEVLTVLRDELVASGGEGQVVRDAAQLVAGQLGVPAESITRALGVHRQEQQGLE